MKKLKLLNLLVILSSLMVYLEWAGGNHGFLFQLEAQVLRKIFSAPREAMHPFIIIPLLGQILLFTTILRKPIARKLTFVSISCLSLLVLLITFIGFMAGNIKIILSAIPFIAFSLWSVIAHLKYSDNKL